MGCWNQTCGLTTIHIRAGERVMIIPLANATDEGLYYTTPFYTPFPLPFYGNYNDYGAAEDCEGVGLQYAMDYLKSNLVEVEQGDNQYHDIPVKKDVFDEAVFWEAIHERRLKLTGAWNERVHDVEMVMIKQSVFDHLATHFTFSDYDYDRPTGQFTYFKYTLEDVIASLPEFVDVLMKPRFAQVDDMSDEDYAELIALTRSYDPIRIAAMNMTRDDDRDKIPMKDGRNLAASWLENFGMHLSGAFATGLVDSWAMKLVVAGDRDGLIDLLTAHLNMKFVDRVMMHTRKFWSPQTGSGSQQQDQAGYRAIIAAMTHVLDEEKAEYEDYEDE